MTVPDIRIVALGGGGRPEASAGPDEPYLPTVLMGPSLGTSVTSLWGPVAGLLSGKARVLGWDLPGHGGQPAAGGDFTMAELARGIVAALDAVLGSEEEKNIEHSFIYAGCSVGGCVGQQLLLDHPGRVRAAVLVATAQRVGTPESWRERAELVAQAGTPTQVIGSAKRWFAEGFISRDAQAGGGVTTRLLHDLQEADRHGYAQVCEALARFDLRGRLGSVAVPVTVLGGAQDVSTTPEDLQELAAAIPGSRYVEYDGVAHLPPAEIPGEVAQEIAAVIETVTAQPIRPSGERPPMNQDRTQAQAHADGMKVRREVLSDAHVDRTEASKNDFTEDWQDFISRYAWGEIWTRPGLDRPMRSAITLTALIAGGHWGEFEMHVRSALRNGLTREQIKEILLQSAIYLSVPSANNAFSHARRVFDELDAEADAGQES